jgi:putative tricarboxylic transport membrane protein
VWDLRNNRDFLAGLLFMLLGGLAVLLASDFPMGTTMRMGPGYFPTLIGGILFLFGAYLLVRGVRFGEKVRGAWGWRPLALITLSIVVFGFLLERLGLVPSALAMFFVAAAAGPEFRVKEVLILAVVMTVFSVLVFIWGLKLPYPLLPGVLWIF